MIRIGWMYTKRTVPRAQREAVGWEYWKRKGRVPRLVLTWYCLLERDVLREVCMMLFCAFVAEIYLCAGSNKRKVARMKWRRENY